MSHKTFQALKVSNRQGARKRDCQEAASEMEKNIISQKCRVGREHCQESVLPRSMLNATERFAKKELKGCH